VSNLAAIVHTYISPFYAPIMSSVQCANRTSVIASQWKTDFFPIRWTFWTTFSGANFPSFMSTFFKSIIESVDETHEDAVVAPDQDSFHAAVHPAVVWPNIFSGFCSLGASNFSAIIESDDIPNVQTSFESNVGPIVDTIWAAISSTHPNPCCCAYASTPGPPNSSSNNSAVNAT